MPFQIKDFNSITLSQINHARAVTSKITDFQPGSVARTLMEAPAVEVEELYLQMFLGLRDAIPVATFRSFGFEKLPAAIARGFVSVSTSDALSEAINIPLGTLFTATDGRVYKSTTEVNWPISDSFVRVPVRYSLPGIAGNIAQGLIVASDLFDSRFEIGNALIVTGKDAESDAERESRFSDFIKSLSRGTTQACLYAAGQSVVLDIDGNVEEYVTRVGIEEISGRVTIWIYSSQGAASSFLLADGQLRLDGYRDEVTGVITPGFRPAGVRVDAVAMTERQVGMAISVRMLSTHSLTSAVQQQIRDIYDASIRAVLPGETLYLGTLVDAMLAASGVAEIVPGTNANITSSESEALIPGTLTISSL